MRDGQRFKALFFDFDETLVPEYEASDAAVEELAAEIQDSHPLGHGLRSTLRSVAYRRIHNTPMGAATIKAFGPGADRWAADELMWAGYELVWDDKPMMTELGQYLGDFRRQVWTEALETLGVADTQLAHKMAERLPRTTHEKRVPYSDAETVLTTLGRRYPMAVLTNGEPKTQAHKVENSGLKHHFDHIVLCDEHGSKPDPKPFEVAMDLLGSKPEEVVMIGNSIANDIAGARNAGIYSVWINRGVGQASARTDVRPDTTIKELSELLDLL